LVEEQDMPNQMPDTDLVSLDGRAAFRIRSCRHGTMVFLIADHTIGRALDLYGEFAESENRLMTDLLRPGDIALDVGANVGTVTLALARQVGPNGQVYAFEPQRLVFQALCTSLTLNGMLHVTPVHVAVGREPGTVQVPTIDVMRPGNYGATTMSQSGEGEGTPLLTIDSLQLNGCNLIKIDVEGMDYDVLVGAADTIARTRPYVYMEAKKGPRTQQAIAWLQERAYRCYWHFAAFYSRDNFRNVTENVFGGRGDINLLAVPTERDVHPKLPLIHVPDSDWQQDYQAYLSGRGRGSS
jgi:FkbM family methyltransferase